MADHLHHIDPGEACGEDLLGVEGQFAVVERNWLPVHRMLPGEAGSESLRSLLGPSGCTCLEQTCCDPPSCAVAAAGRLVVAPCAVPSAAEPFAVEPSVAASFAAAPSVAAPSAAGKPWPPAAAVAAKSLAEQLGCGHQVASVASRVLVPRWLPLGLSLESLSFDVLPY